MDTAPTDLMIDWDEAWRNVAFAANNLKLLLNKGRYSLVKFDLTPKLRIDRMMAAEMGVEPYLAKWMLGQ